MQLVLINLLKHRLRHTQLSMGKVVPVITSNLCKKIEVAGLIIFKNNKN